MMKDTDSIMLLVVSFLLFSGCTAEENTSGGAELEKE